MEDVRTMLAADYGTDQIVTATLDATGVPVVELHGDIDLGVIEPLRDGVVNAVEQGTDVLVDLAGVTLIDCASLGVLVQADRLAVRRGVRVFLVAPSPIVSRTLAAAGLDAAFPTFNDYHEAFRELSPDPYVLA